ncbi:MAG: methyltransferase, TrmH family [Chloroflexota bacterium]|nr:methyltransferase, TrmH family [Chloroflexota bacterium]
MNEQITSSANPNIKALRKLQGSKGRKNSGNFYVEGLKLVGDALDNRAPIEQIVYCPELLVSDFGDSILSQAAKREIATLNVSASVFNSFALKSGPQGVAAVVRQNWQELETSGAEQGLWLVLEDVQDPGNLGSALRSLDGAGGSGLILLGDSTDAYHPTAVRASMGSIFTQKLVKTDTQTLGKWKQQHDATIVGTWCGNAQPYRSYNYPDDVILMSGSEQKGLQPEHLAICDALVHIPMNGYVDSLNLACATSVVLFEIYDQRCKREQK